MLHDLAVVVAVGPALGCAPVPRPAAPLPNATLVTYASAMKR
jgi:hypothetical protein